MVLAHQESGTGASHRASPTPYLEEHLCPEHTGPKSVCDVHANLLAIVDVTPNADFILLMTLFHKMDLKMLKIQI